MARFYDFLRDSSDLWSLPVSGGPESLFWLWNAMLRCIAGWWVNSFESVMFVFSSIDKSLLGGQFSKALNRFQKEDPTFRVSLDPDSGQVGFLCYQIFLPLYCHCGTTTPGCYCECHCWQF